MRFLSVLINDIRYQAKYGFYFLYAFISILYIAILFLCPESYRKTALALIILSDPAMLGYFFIGGIWLLEKGEGLHGYWGITPLRPIEYVLSKAVSLAVISVISAGFTAAITLGTSVNLFLLALDVFAGSMIFTVAGLFVASYARSVNHYMLLATPFAVFAITPPILAAFSITHPIFWLFPGMALWRVIGDSIGLADKISVLPYLILAIWFGAVLLSACGRMPRAMQAEGGESV